MLKPESIDLTSLPWLPLEEKSAFPKRACIYFAIDSLGVVQYIGRSVNVKQRWSQHHKYDDLLSLGYVKIAYLFVDTPELLPDIEKALIRYFQPSLNVIGRISLGCPRKSTSSNKSKKSKLSSKPQEIKLCSSNDSKATFAYDKDFSPSYCLMRILEKTGQRNLADKKIKK